MGIRERIFGKRVHEAGTALVMPSGKPRGFGLNAEEQFAERSDLFKKYKKAYEVIPLITAIIDVQADQAVQEFFFEGPNSEKLTKWADKMNLSQFFHRIAKSLLLYGNSYVEVLPTELKIINPVWMDVYREPTGEIIGYSQIIENEKLVLWGSTGDKDKDDSFKKKISSFDNLVHFRHNVISSEKYGLSIIHPLLESLNIKLDMESNLRKVLFKYVAPLIWAKVGNDQFPANSSIVADISGTLRDLQAESEITTSHLVDLSVLEFNAKGMDIETPLKHIEAQIITGGLVPPVLLGREGSGTQNAEVQLRSFGRHIKALQRELKNEFEDKIIISQSLGSEEDKLIWTQAEEREREIEMDILRGLVTDGIITPQKANDLLPPRFREKLPEAPDLLNQQDIGANGLQKPRPNQMKNDKVKDNPNDPTQTTKLKSAKNKRVKKTDRKVPIK